MPDRSAAGRSNKILQPGNGYFHNLYLQSLQLKPAAENSFFKQSHFHPEHLTNRSALSASAASLNSKLFEEAQIIRPETADILDLIAQHRNPFRAHPKSKTRINSRVITAVRQAPPGGPSHTPGFRASRSVCRPSIRCRRKQNIQYPSRRWVR